MINFRKKLYKKAMKILIKSIAICMVFLNISYTKSGEKIQNITLDNNINSELFMLLHRPIYNFKTSKNNLIFFTFSSVITPHIITNEVPDFKTSFFSLDILSQNQLNLTPYDILFSSSFQIAPPTPLQELKDQITKKEFLISYKIYVKNGIAQGEKYNVSEPIKKRVESNEYEFDYTCKIDTHIVDYIDDDLDYVLRVILTYQKEAVLECLYKGGIKVEDNSMTHNSQSSTKTLLTLPAKSVVAYLDRNFLILEVWKEKKKGKK